MSSVFAFPRRLSGPSQHGRHRTRDGTPRLPDGSRRRGLRRRRTGQGSPASSRAGCPFTMGPQGRLRDARPSRAISLLDIYEAIEGPMGGPFLLFSGSCPFGFDRCSSETSGRGRTDLPRLLVPDLDRLTREGA